MLRCIKQYFPIKVKSWDYFLQEIQKKIPDYIIVTVETKIVGPSNGRTYETIFPASYEFYNKFKLEIKDERPIVFDKGYGVLSNYGYSTEEMLEKRIFCCQDIRKKIKMIKERFPFIKIEIKDIENILNTPLSDGLEEIMRT